MALLCKGRIWYRWGRYKFAIDDHCFRCCAHQRAGQIPDVAWSGNCSGLRWVLGFWSFLACLLGIAAGPFLGAVLAQEASWRWVFWMMAPSTSRSLQSPDNSRISYHCLDTLYRAPKTVGGKLIAKDQTDGLARNCAQSFHVGVHTGEFAQCSRADG
jgi:hypothetical protein